jgi:hypothetical protein
MASLPFLLLLLLLLLLLAVVLIVAVAAVAQLAALLLVHHLLRFKSCHHRECLARPRSSPKRLEAKSAPTSNASPLWLKRSLRPCNWQQPSALALAQLLQLLLLLLLLGRKGKGSAPSTTATMSCAWLWEELRIFWDANNNDSNNRQVCGAVEVQ